jgi:AcrR family transcriptional regulator
VTAPTHPTQVRILETARRLFHEQGYHATGIATILREAGVHSGSLYHAFPSKESLLAAVLTRYHDVLLSERVMGPVEARERDPVERVFALLAFYRLGLDASGCTMGCPIGNLALEVSDSHPEMRALLGRNFDAWAARVRGWLDEAGERLPRGCDRAALARFVLTTMEGGVMLARAAGGLAPFDAAVRALRSHFDLLAREAERARGADGKSPRRRTRTRGGRR